MAYTDDSSQTTKANTVNPNKKLSSLNSNIFTMLAAFCGVVFGVLGSLGFVTSYIHSELANQTASISHVISARNADSVTACTVPGGGGGASVTTASASSPASASVTPGLGGGGGAGGGGGTSFVSQLVNGAFAPSTGTISNTGQGSSNQVNSTQTANMNVTNNNNLTAVNVNPQTAVSGNTTSNNNTTTSGTGSGDSSNSSNTNVTYNVNN